MRLHLIESAQLANQKRGENLRRNPARADIVPCVLVYLPSKEPRPIGSSLTQHFAPIDEPIIVDHQRATFAAGDVLRFMETERRHRTESSQLLPIERGSKAVRVVFDQRQAVAVCQCRQIVDVFCYAGVVDCGDRCSAVRDRCLHGVHIKIERVWGDVDEHWPGTCQGEG